MRLIDGTFEMRKIKEANSVSGLVDHMRLLMTNPTSLFRSLLPDLRKRVKKNRHLPSSTSIP